MQINYVTSFKLPKKFTDKRIERAREPESIGIQKVDVENMNTKTKLTLSQWLAVRYIRSQK